LIVVLKDQVELSVRKIADVKKNMSTPLPPPTETQKIPKRTATPGESAIAGALAGVIAVTGSYPFDLIKTRLQFAAKQQGLFERDFKKSTITTNQ